jgi:hypothetical protein
MAGELGFDTGPYVNVAVFCEKTLQESDGVLSLIRIVDTINVQAVGPSAPDHLPDEGIPLDTTLVIILKPGQAKGNQSLRVVMEHPSGERHDGPEMSIPFSGAGRTGVNVLLPVKMMLKDAGLYWADVFVNGRLVTRVPLEISYGYQRPPG